jgi:hypothetical protein
MCDLNSQYVAALDRISGSSLGKLNRLKVGPMGKAHPVVPGSPICGMRMPSAAGARGHLVAASDRRLDSPAGPKGRRYCHRHADKQLKAPEKLETHPPFQISLATPIC